MNVLWGGECKTSRQAR